VSPVDAADAVAELLALEPAALARTHEILCALRQRAAVPFVPANGCYALTRYDDVVAVLRDPARFSSRAVTGPRAGAELAGRLTEHTRAGAGPARDGRRAARLAAFLARTLEGYREVLLSADPPVHSRHRQAIGYAFSPKRVAAQEPLIRTLADELIDGFNGSTVDVVRDFADPLPLLVIARALGVEDGDLARFRRWSNAMMSVVGNPDPSDPEVTDYLRVLFEFGDYFSRVIAARRAEPRDDLISDIATSRVDEGVLAVTEILPMLQQFLVAGNETTGKLIASTVWVLLTHPAELAAVRADPGRLPAVVEEVLRLHTPVLGLYRQVNRDTEVGGCPVPAGGHLWVLYPSANRDERRFADPDQFRPDRLNVKQHVAFGYGPHYCVGASLARTEATIAVTTLLSRLPELRLAEGWAGPRYAPSHALHGLAELPVSV